MSDSLGFRAMEKRITDPKKIIAGVIGVDDPHIIGIKILGRIFSAAGFKVVMLGARCEPKEFIEAAIESAGDLMLISSNAGHGEIHCRDFPLQCIEAGLGNVLLYLGGRLVVGNQKWEEVEKKFREMGFHRVFPPATDPYRVVEYARQDLKIG